MPAANATVYLFMADRSGQLSNRFPLRFRLVSRELTAIRSAIDDALRSAGDAFTAGDRDRGRQSLERAHVLAQPWAWPHTKVHLGMLRRGWAARDGTEIRGQLTRAVVAAIGSVTGRYPVGNTGRARVRATAPMPLDADTSELLARAGQRTA